MDHAEATKILHEAGALIVMEPELFDRLVEMVHDGLVPLMAVRPDDEYGQAIYTTTAGSLDASGDMQPYTRIVRG